MNLIDFLIIIIVLLGMWRGFKVGLIQSVVSLAGWLVAFLVGTKFSTNLAHLFSSVVDSHVLQVALAFLSIVLIMLGIIYIVASIIRSAMNTLKLNFLDKLAGGALGTATHILIVLIVISIATPFLIQVPMWHQSVLATELLPYAPVATDMMKEVLGEAWQDLQPKNGFSK